MLHHPWFVLTWNTKVPRVPSKSAVPGGSLGDAENELWEPERSGLSSTRLTTTAWINIQCQSNVRYPSDNNAIPWDPLIHFNLRMFTELRATLHRSVIPLSKWTKEHEKAHILSILFENQGEWEHLLILQSATSPIEPPCMISDASKHLQSCLSQIRSIVSGMTCILFVAPGSGVNWLILYNTNEGGRM
jgi:hypothetical protein